MAEGEISRRWEAERRDVKRAEARLRHGLQNLEDARLSYLSSMTKEQKRLQQELLKLQKSRSKQKLSVDRGQISMKLTLPLLSSKARSMRKLLHKPGGSSSTHQPPLNLQPVITDVSGYEKERKEHLPSLKATDQKMVVDSDVTTLENSITKQLSISAASVEQEEADGREDQGKELSQEEAKVAEVVGEGTNNKLLTLPGKRKPFHGPERLIMDPEAYGVDGHLRTMYNRPDFLKSYAEAKKARYIRHKNIPAWEKVLSIKEIFGHEKVIQQSPTPRRGGHLQPPERPNSALREPPISIEPLINEN